MYDVNLEAAIAKWDAVAAGVDADKGPCALCKAYNDCRTCVIGKVAVDGCDGTPFADWARLAKETGQWSTRSAVGVRATTPEMVDAAERMAAFLRSLRSPAAE